ncbi:hypothetical protein NDI37_07120 [Funiculus sociatus GB2-A5]|uniref:Uncharacterized protein n=1 Tax=Funiculus sociatus GB2-A5 TaxID=2933946 RepID=A0ABV0JLD2_9CYAN|nr:MULTISPECIES: hypothetical protein [unclassified Trichocoleus]MBD1908275.1 hypothetical protein [Trichocoleus sp. FACHB-832]MBD2065518.1 hypothetical protein [Trichocoleus sp. FACHB-6]
MKIVRLERSHPFLCVLLTRSLHTNFIIGRKYPDVCKYLVKIDSERWQLYLKIT